MKKTGKESCSFFLDVHAIRKRKREGVKEKIQAILLSHAHNRETESLSSHKAKKKGGKRKRIRRKEEKLTPHLQHLHVGYTAP